MNDFKDEKDNFKDAIIVLDKCVVNADNEFEFLGKTFKIDENNTDYKVDKPYSEKDEYENIAKMSDVYITLSTVDKSLNFDVRDENMKTINYTVAIDVEDLYYPE